MIQSTAPYTTEHCSYTTEHCSLRYRAQLCTTSNIKTPNLPHSF